MSTGAQVVRLGAWCDVDDFTWRKRTEGRLIATMDFDVHEYAVLDDDRRLTLRTDRGWGRALSVLGDRSTSRNPWDHLTEDDVRRSIFIAMMPDDLADDAEPDDAHPFGHLAQLLVDHGVHTTTQALRALPYDVELGPRLRAHFVHDAAPRFPATD
ncbi:hypothetical protein WDZ16_01345 [Pseudokineococcus marinus]|uniref:Uncharacterized protein n=1 Tax=Pseudokineococcus marinus TaxID=351215 RepID=A0A849BEP3_9ACTN|nr:hypothetical protein [Pseudokineococcus marinus]NNH21509.1 hypothetical protein [Pseudokineococcus marinus]